MKKYSKEEVLRQYEESAKNKIVYELKPNNPNQIKKGTKQLAGYLEEIETVFGEGWSSVLDTY